MHQGSELPVVFVYSGYRTGSTWLWNKFRNHPSTYAYYEPFNEALASLTPDTVLSTSPASWRSHHPGDAAYMTEYVPLLAGGSGVPLFPAGNQNGKRYIGASGVEGPLDPDIKDYTANLILAAQERGRVPVLSCTRMLGRVAGFRRAFKGQHILLVRNLFQQWASYSGQLRSGNEYFFYTVFSSLEISPNDEFIAFLGSHFRGEDIQDFKKWSRPENHDLIFCYFAAIQIYFLMLANRRVDVLIDLNRLARSGEDYQQSVSELISKRTGIRIDLSDVRESVDYPLQPLNSVNDCHFLLSSFADRLLATVAIDDEERRFVEGLISDLWDEHARFTSATAGAVELISQQAAETDAMGRRMAELEAQYAEGVAGLIETERKSDEALNELESRKNAELAQSQASVATLTERLARMEVELSESMAGAAAAHEALGQALSQAEEQARSYDEQLAMAASAAADASAQFDEASRRVAELEGRLVADAAAHGAALAEAQAAAADASAQVGAALDRVAELESRLASEADVHGAALAEARAAVVNAEHRSDAAMQRVAELENEIASQAGMHAAVLTEARAAGTSALGQLGEAMQRVGELEARLASEATAYGSALVQAHAVATDLAAQLGVAQERAGRLEREYAAEAAAHAQELDEAKAAAHHALAKLDDALEREADLNRRLIAEIESSAAAGAAASAFASEVAAQLELARAKSTGLEEQLKEQGRLHSAALGVAEDRFSVAQLALAESNKQLAALQNEHLTLTRLVGRLEGEFAISKQSYAERLRDAATLREELRTRLDRAELEVAESREVVAQLRADLAVCISDAEIASAEATADKKALNELVLNANEEISQLTARAEELDASRAMVCEERDAYLAQAEGLAIERDSLVADLESTRDEAAEAGRILRDECSRLTSEIAFRQARLEDAHRMLSEIPDLMPGATGLRGFMLRRVIGQTQLAATTDFVEAARQWQQDALSLEIDPNSCGIESPLDYEAPPSHAAATFGGLKMSANEEPISSVAQLLAANDRPFVHSAYWLILGRGPDADGESYYLSRLRSGVHKLSILKQLRNSPEGRAFQPTLAGLDLAIKRHVLVNFPLIGIFFAPFVKAERDSSTKVALRRIEQNLIAEMAGSNSALSSGELKGSLDWIDARIGRLLELSVDLDARAKEMQGALDRFADGTAELFVSGNQERTGNVASALTNVNSGRQEAAPLTVRDLHDRTGTTSVDEVLRRIELEISC